MEHFLDEAALRNSRKRARRYTGLSCALAGAGLVCLIVLCLLTRTGNARTTLALAMAGSVLFGWAVIAVWLFAAEPARAEEKHLSGLAELEPEIREGRLTVSGDVFRIPKSVRVRKVRLETEGETLSLNLNEKLAGRMPPDGSLVRAEIARKFITGLEVLSPGPEQGSRPKPSRLRNVLRALGRFLLPALFWAALAMIFTGFVFNLVTDAAPEDKIVLYADCDVRNAPELAEKLEQALGGAVRMVKIHPFSYALFDSVRLKHADLYLIPDSHLPDYRDWLSPEEGVPVDGSAAGETFLLDPAETYRLYTGADSVHLEDGLARRAADLLLSLTDDAKEETP